MHDKDKISQDYFDFMLKRALDEYAEEEGKKYEEGLENIDEPNYSDEYKKAINQLLVNKYYHKKAKFRSKQIAAAVLILVVSGTTVVYKADADLRWFFIQLFTDRGTHIDISQNKTTINYDFSNIPEEWEYFYVPEYLPAGYKVDEIMATTTDIIIVYKFNDNEIIFTQGNDKESSLSIDTEHSNVHEIKIGGNEGYYLEGKNANTLVWYSDDQCFQLDGVLEKRELKKIAESTKIVDR